MLVLNHNVPAMSSLNSLNSVYQQMADVQKQMSTGKRINSAKDDPSGLSIATKMNVRISSMQVAKNNVADANNLLNIADGGLKGISEALQTVRELTMQAKNDTLGTNERTAIQDSINSLVSEIDDYVGQAQYNGIALIDGTADLSMQTGPDGGDTTQVTIAQDFQAAGLSIDAIDVSDTTSAGTAIDAIDAALAVVDKGRTDIGALQNRFDSKADFLDTATENLTAAVSRIEDYDYAKGQAEMMKLQTQFQANMAALGQAIQLPQNILSLL
jgi:flagellin